MSGGRRMRAWQLPAGCTSVEQLELVELPRPDPAPGEVLVRVHATSLNYRDQAIAQGRYFGAAIKVAGTPLSDGAGVVEAVGAGVKALAPADRVAGTFFQAWLEGPPAPAGPSTTWSRWAGSVHSRNPSRPSASAAKLRSSACCRCRAMPTRCRS